jgi:3-hydroxyacyl-CoA dehydrogenase/enoyl-CoA hydratase/3-hydroxybutyryl-CoA epimerase/3-hydroxyacyl-CoA dehydrogenase/enoyl-CoA hydratase/3-hydroxybutyryl-CoA epimerase/enoyl-CoA isomerase
LVGLDTACSAGTVLAEAFGDRIVSSALLDQLVEAGRLGKKTGAGFRKFVKRKKLPVSDPDLLPFLENNRVNNRTFSDEELQDRLFLPMLLEATRCLQEAIVREPTHVDMGLILGIGFPVFRGGLLRWCDQQGAEQLLKRLNQYQSLGKRFEPTELLLEQSRQNRLFYPLPKL